MKNFKFIYAIGLMSALFTAKNVNAQSYGTTGYWNLRGNGTTNDSINFVGTIDSKDLKFRTNNAERMSIHRTNGKVSIGTAPFSYLGQLTVKGSNAIAINGTNPYFSLYENGVYKGYLWSRGTSGDIVVGASTPTGNVILAPNYVDALVATPSGYIGIGTTIPTSKLEVQGAAGLTSPVSYSKVNYAGTSDVIAVKGVSQPALGYGVGVEGTGGYIGVRGNASTPGSTGFNYGGYFNANGTGSGRRCGVWASASGSTSTDPVTGFLNNWALYSSGNSFATGLWLSSDARLKKDVKPLQNSIDKIMQLKPSSYLFKTDEFSFMNLPTEKQDGFLAQDLEKVFPEMVGEIQQPLMDEKGNPTKESFTFKGVNYIKMIPVLVAALQEEHVRNNSLENKNQMLEQKVNEMQQCLVTLCNENKSSSKSDQTINSKPETQNVLFQNQPNPFNQSTVIRYKLSADSKSANIIIRDLNGNLLKSIAASAQGEGQATINAEEFDQGTYTYTLIVNEISVDTKLMVITK